MRLTADGVEVLVDPDHGGRLASLVVHGEELLVTDPGHGIYGWGCYPMVPWAGRVRHGRFRFDGVDVTLPLGMPPHAIHGVGLSQAWSRSAPDELVTDLVDPWPFGGRAVQRFDLTAERLRVVLSIDTDGPAMPAVLGWHPWFRRRLASGEAVSVDFVADRMLERDGDGIPSGAIVSPTVGPWDDCFTGVQQPVTLDWGTLVLELTSSCEFWVAYTEPDDAVCFEPQSAPPDALNGGADLVGPGRDLTHWFELRWRGRAARPRGAT